MDRDINVQISGPVQPTSLYKTVVLKGNLPFADQVSKPNTKYVIKHNFDLGGGIITFKSNCLIEFDGGSLSNGTIIGQNTILEYNHALNIFNNITKQGTFVYNNILSADEQSLTEDENIVKIKDGGILTKHLSNNSVNGAKLNPSIVDDEDIHFTNDKQLQFKDKEYNAELYSGLGRVYLRKNIVNGVNTLTQDMLYKGEAGSRVPNTNTVFVIQYDFTLGGDITIPANCILDFQGGSISGAYTLTANKTAINAGLVKIFNTDITLNGSWNVAEAYPEWFGINSNDSTDALQKCIDSFSVTRLVRVYSITRPIRIKKHKTILGHEPQDISSAIYVRNFVPVEVEYKEKTEEISSVFYGYESGDTLYIDSIYIDGGYLAESCMYGHSLGGFHVDAINCNIRKFYGAAFRLTISDSYTIYKCLIRYCFIAVYISSYDENPLINPLDIGTTTGSYCNDARIKECAISLGVFGVICKGVSNVTITGNTLSHLSCNPIFIRATGNAFINNNYFEGDFHLSFNIVQGQSENPTTGGDTVLPELLDLLTAEVNRNRAIITCYSNHTYGCIKVGPQYISLKYIRTTIDDVGLISNNTIQGIDGIIYAANGNVIVEHLSAQDLGSKHFKYHIIQGGTCALKCNIDDARIFATGLVNASLYALNYNGNPKELLDNSFPKNTVLYYNSSTGQEASTKLASIITDMRELEDVILIKSADTYCQKIDSSVFKDKVCYKISLLLLNPTDKDKEFKLFVKDNNGNVIKKVVQTIAAGKYNWYSVAFDLIGVTCDFIYIYLESSTDLFHSAFCVSTLSVTPTFNKFFLSEKLPNCINMPEGFKIIYEGIETIWRKTIWLYTDGTLALRYSNNDFTWAYRNKLTGPSSARPNFTGYGRYKYYDETLSKYIYWNGSAWVDEEGINMNNVNCIKGTTATRTLMADQSEEIHIGTDNEGLKYYDTDLHKYVLWNGNDWVNLDGSALS